MTIPGAGDFAELAHFELHPPSIRVLPRALCERRGAVLLGRLDADATRPVTVGMLDPGDRRTLRQISDFLMRPVEPVRLNRFEVERALAAGWGEDGEASGLVVRSRPVGPTSSASELVEHLFASAIAARASDIHLETYHRDVDLRLRVDGILHQVYTEVHPENLQEVVSRIKVLARLDIAERRRSQDGRIRCTLAAEGSEPETVDLRVSVVPGPAGEDVAVRILHPGVGLIPVARLGMAPEIEQAFRRLIANPEGLVLVTGPTGSGKTTTLYAALAQMNDGRRKIVTVEDPIEYYLPKINQKQVGPTMSMLDLLRALLRQDPNVILVGEVRDLETGSTALAAAATGHVVLSTLHTPDAVGAVGRLRGLGLDSDDIANALLAVLAQRLVRRVCADCAHPAPGNDRQRRILGGLADGVEAVVGEGCPACAHSGYRGRIAIHELLLADEGLQDLIAAGAHGAELLRYARQRGMRTLVEDAFDKVRTGTTTLDEVIRVVPYRKLLAARRERGEAV